MATSAEQVKQLREQTGAGMLDCKKALDMHGGDVAKATAWLMEKGLASAAKKASRETNEGVIQTYVHAGARMAVIVEVNCETDFVARTPEFKAVAHDIAIHIASTSPKYVRKEDIPAEVLNAQIEKFKQDAMKEGKPANIAERIAQGRMEKYYQENVLLEQQFVKDDSLKMSELLKATVAKIGENIVIRRFTRYELGGE
ncbi:MAG: translation elongation factor Ts [Chloroflexi bacterium]|jgi:elongation factor Ts|nr:translation elongation factor Ts [Chloroflexota bacterium]